MRVRQMPIGRLLLIRESAPCRGRRRSFGSTFCSEKRRGECRAPDAPTASCALGSGNMHTSIHCAGFAARRSSSLRLPSPGLGNRHHGEPCNSPMATATKHSDHTNQSRSTNRFTIICTGAALTLVDVSSQDALALTQFNSHPQPKVLRGRRIDSAKSDSVSRAKAFFRNAPPETVEMKQRIPAVISYLNHRCRRGKARPLRKVYQDQPQFRDATSNAVIPAFNSNDPNILRTVPLAIALDRKPVRPTAYEPEQSGERGDRLRYLGADRALDQRGQPDRVREDQVDPADHQPDEDAGPECADRKFTRGHARRGLRGRRAGGARRRTAGRDHRARPRKPAHANGPETCRAQSSA